MNDELLFEDEDEEAEGGGHGVAAPWLVMIVDDEESVHQVTHLVMSDFSYEGRGLRFIDCYSAAEARRTLAPRPDVALILLDVVMETEHAGLDLVRHIREELGDSAVRIVLRTGQPGQAPQEHVIQTYDINDYREKTDLTQGKMRTVFYAALRGYRDLRRLERARDGLRRSIDAITAVGDAHTLPAFCSAVLAQAGALLGGDGEGVCASRIGAAAAARLDAGLRVLAVTPAYAALATPAGLEHGLERGLDRLPEPARAALARAMDERAGHHGALHHLCYHRTPDGNESFLYMAFGEPIGPDEREMLAAFCANVALTYEKLVLREEAEASHEASIALLAGAIARRSPAPGARMRRVGALAALLAGAAGMAPARAGQLRLAAPLRDIGHSGVPDSVLHHPGALDALQWQAMRRHPLIGQAMLAASTLPLLQLAGAIAHQHHERWDGTGYPQALAGERISLEARATTLADAVDAMLGERPYRPALSLDETLRRVREASASQFDPRLVELLFEHLAAWRGWYQDPAPPWI